MTDFKWATKMGAALPAVEQLRKQLEQKRGHVLYLSELTTLFWYGELKGEYLVHIDLFL